MIRKVYLDMDGVLCDFEATVERYFDGVPFADLPEDIYESLIDKEFFRWMEPMVGFADLVRFAAENFDEVEILSAAGDKNLDLVVREKVDWLERHVFPLIGEIPLNFVGNSRAKAAFAAPDVVLVDDRWKAYEPFAEAGGNIVVFEGAEGAIADLAKYI